METALAHGGRSPSCFRRKKDFQSKQLAFDVEALLRKLIRPKSHTAAWPYEERTNEELLNFVVEFFEDSLNSLRTVGSPDEKAEILEWIFEPRKVHLIHKSQVIEVLTEKFAFSFRWCCKLFGYDAEELQQQILLGLVSLDCYKQHKALFDKYCQTYII